MPVIGSTEHTENMTTEMKETRHIFDQYLYILQNNRNATDNNICSQLLL